MISKFLFTFNTNKFNKQIKHILVFLAEFLILKSIRLHLRVFF